MNRWYRLRSSTLFIRRFNCVRCCMTCVKKSCTEGTCNSYYYRTIIGIPTKREKTADTFICKAAVALYYHAVEAILYCGKVRLMNHQNSAMSTHTHSFMNQIVLLESFHRALLDCCSVCGYQSVRVYSETTCITLHATYVVRFYFVHHVR
jgi:hypothetical protein